MDASTMSVCREGAVVTARKIYSGAACRCWKEYASPSLARKAARRLIAKLAKAKNAEEHNAIVQAWYDRP